MKILLTILQDCDSIKDVINLIKPLNGKILTNDYNLISFEIADDGIYRWHGVSNIPTVSFRSTKNHYEITKFSLGKIRGPNT